MKSTPCCCQKLLSCAGGRPGAKTDHNLQNPVDDVDEEVLAEDADHPVGVAVVALEEREG